MFRHDGSVFLFTRTVCLVVLLLASAGFYGVCQTIPAGPNGSTKAPILLTPADVPTCKQIQGSYPVDLQLKILYESTETYPMLPPVKSKGVQSFECAGEKGSVYYFEFSDDVSRQRAAAFLKGLLWGEEHPTKTHPELILGVGATLAVVSFKTPPEPLVNTLTAKMGINTTATAGNEFKLALPNYRGQLRWSSGDFKIVESSAKPAGNEIGIRTKDHSGQVSSLGFLFLFPEQSPMTSEKCRDGVLEPAKKENRTLKVETTETIGSGDIPATVVSYTTRDESGKMWYIVRSFVATNAICGDLEFSSDRPISGDANIRSILATYRLDKEYIPTFTDAFLYAQVLYNLRKYKEAAPIFELALSRLPDGDPDGKTRTIRRVVTDQAGMAYGISGNISKARAIFEVAITKDPDYPLNYYNLACADAEEKNLTDARKHLQEAFARRANVLPGERMPNPLQDDSFLRHRNDKEFWAFLKSLQEKQ